MSIFDLSKKVPPGTLSFRCNICGSSCTALASALSRETPSCPSCGSTVRMRGMIHALSSALFYRSLAIPDFPVRKEIVGKGMSDWDGYAIPLAKKLSYTNTFYHKVPRLDITEISSEDCGSVDFLLSTDVFEHVTPPVSRAFENARSMLRDNGAFVFSVPYVLTGPTTEHFPNLFEYRIEVIDERKVLVNKTREGLVERFENLVFHGGEGETLETRVFSLPSLLEDLTKAGFSDVRIMSEPCFEHGVFWPQPWSLPIIARPSAPSVIVAEWGPQAKRIEKNTQALGQAKNAIWINVKQALDEIPSIRIGDIEAEGVVSTSGLVTALVPSAVSQAVGKYPVILRYKDFTPTLVGELLIHD